jgi:1-acyl-sn-glycerol-3-phosphate acyltransferase
LLWIKEVKGLTNIPNTGPVILAFNHQSYFDFIGFIAVSPRPIYYLAAEKFYNKDTSPIWKPFMDATGQIRVDRSSKDKNHVYSAVSKLLHNGDMLGIFPEGTRVNSCSVMQRGYTGVVKFAIANNVPVIPVGILGAYEIMSRVDKYPKIKKILEFHIGKPISYENLDTSNITDDELQKLTDKLMVEISKLSGKQYPYGD